MIPPRYRRNCELENFGTKRPRKICTHEEEEEEEEEEEPNLMLMGRRAESMTTTRTCLPQARCGCISCRVLAR